MRAERSLCLEMYAFNFTLMIFPAESDKHFIFGTIGPSWLNLDLRDAPKNLEPQSKPTKPEEYDGVIYRVVGKHDKKTYTVKLTGLKKHGYRFNFARLGSAWTELEAGTVYQMALWTLLNRPPATTHPTVDLSAASSAVGHCAVSRHSTRQITHINDTNIRAL